MSLELRRRHVPPELQPSIEQGEPPDEDPTRQTDGRNVLVSSGIYRGRFPVGGMQVRHAREILRRLITIDDHSLAVINGQAVSEDDVIGENVTQISFVKPSAIKGSS